MSTIPVLTVDYLRLIHACPRHVVLFKQVFPNGAELTLANLHKADMDGLDWRWLCNRIYIDATTPAKKAYTNATLSAWEAYDVATASAREAYTNAIIDIEVALPYLLANLKL